MKMSAFRTVVESHLKDFSVIESYYIGYIDGEDELQKFMDDMRACGYMFVNRSSNKANKAYFFQRNGKGHTFQINFFGPLFQINKNSLYECSQGKTKNRSRVSLKDNCDIQNEEYAPPLKKRMKDHTSKKIGCEATMHILELRIFSDFTIDEYVPKGSPVQSSMVRKLKDEMTKSPGPKSFNRFMIKVSEEAAHNHSVESSSKTLNLHPRLIEEIKTLTKHRVCSVKEVKSHLKEFVDKTFIREINTVPDLNNTCFYPTEKVIHFHMHKDKSTSSLFYNQDGLVNLVNEWSLLVPDNMFMFRSGSDNISKPEDNKNEQGNTFLFCHQTRWQKQLLQRYGNYICHLETAAHNGGRDSFMKLIPLYVLSVKTNVGFTCVAWFIIQEQSSVLVQEALSVILSCNNEWQPQYFLTNCSSVEVDAVQKSFPSTVVFYSPFHRERLWVRWLKVKYNITSLRSERHILGLWKAVAKSHTETELETNLNVLKEDGLYTMNKKAQDYFTTQWLHKDIFHYWIEAYQSEDFLSLMYTSNGMQMQCKAISCKATTLTDLAKFIYEDHLPRVFQKYCQSNTVDITSYTISDCDFLPILELLKERPERFINHVLNNFSTAVRNYNADNITLLDDGDTFSVASDMGGGLEGPFTVKLGDPVCSCPDFSKWRFPCEHMCAIFAHIPEGKIEKLPTSYLYSPYLTLDDQFSEFCFAETEYNVVVFEDNEQLEMVESSECIIDYNNECALVNECSTQSEAVDVESMADTVEILGLPTEIAFKESLITEGEVVDKVQADFRSQLVKVHNMSYFANDVVCLEEGISILDSFEEKIVAQADPCAD